MIEGTDLHDLYQTLRDKLNPFQNSIDSYGLETLFSDFEQFKSAYREHYAPYHFQLYNGHLFLDKHRIMSPGRMDHPDARSTFHLKYFPLHQIFLAGSTP
ncbi:MAG: hypothetical protein ONB31_13260 [candidate division KSB1 bacterium]|nr:hypothetical protein [candidate division KSB1 bacterium]MDZ7357893.1 hypothetical protein [candidate division KSB1 bacterium]